MVYSAYSVEDDLGTLRVAATATAEIVALEAHFVSYATGQEVAVVDDFVLVSGTVQNGVWHTAEPVQLDDLGYYKAIVNVTDGAGDTASLTGSLAYIMRTSFSVPVVNPQTVTYTDRLTQVSGTLTGIMPGNREIVPVPGATVSVHNYGGTAQPVSATTAADGTFTASLEITAPGEVYTYFPGGPGHLNAYSDYTPVSVTPETSQLTVTASATEVDAGQSVTLTGELTWPYGLVVDQMVWVQFCSPSGDCSQIASTRTGTDGSYAVAVTPPQTGYLLVRFTSSHPFISDASARSDVVVWHPAEFVDFAAYREADTVFVGGRIRFGNVRPYPITVEIQYQAPGTNAWTTVTTKEATLGDSSGYWVHSATVTPDSGNWRAYFPGEPNRWRPTATALVYVG